MSDLGAQQPAWYALRLRPNAEWSVSRGLDRLGLEGFLPFVSAPVKWSDRTKTVRRLLFPGYCFVRCAAPELGAAYELAGVLGVLDSKLRPSAISESDMQNVQALILSAPASIAPASIAAGDPVTVTRGALKGVSGVVLKQAKGLRLVVSLPMLNRAVSVELDAADLARV